MDDFYFKTHAKQLLETLEHRPHQQPLDPEEQITLVLKQVYRSGVAHGRRAEKSKIYRSVFNEEKEL